MEKRDHPENIPSTQYDEQTAIGTLDADKLKKIILVLKKKQEAALESLDEFRQENTILKGQQNLLKQLLEQAHRDHEKTRSEFDKVRVSLTDPQHDPEATLKLEQSLIDLRSAQNALRTTQRDLDAAKEMIDAERASAEMQKSRLEKLALAIKERDKRIAELQQFENSYRRALDHKQLLDSALEEEVYAKNTIAEENERLLSEINEGRQHSEQLQRVIQHLRERQEEATLESKQLEEEYLRAQEMVKSLENQLEVAHVALKQSQQENEDSKQRKQQAEHELHQLQEQFKQLKTRTIIVQQELQKKDSSLLSSNQIIDQFKFDKQNLQKELGELRQKAETLSTDLQATQSSLSAIQRLAEDQHQTIHYLNEQNDAQLRHNTSLEQALTETRETIELHQKSLQDAHEWRQLAETKIEAYETESTHYAATHQQLSLRTQEYEAQLETLQSQVGVLSEELALMQAQLSHLKETEEQFYSLDERYVALTEQFRTALSSIKHLEKREEQYQEAILSREHKLTVLHQDNEISKSRFSQLEESLRQSENVHVEKENALKLSHHHLAKKVKECTLLAEKNKELDKALHDLQHTLSKTCSQVDDLNIKLEEHRLAARRQEDQYLESRRQAEEYSRNWEKKYFDMFEQSQNGERKLQNMHNRLQETERQLEKYYQLEALLKNLGIGSPLTTSPSFNDPAPQKSYTADPVEAPAPRFDTPAETPAVNPLPLKQESIFENPNNNYKRKEHLFD